MISAITLTIKCFKTENILDIGNDIVSGI